MEEDLMRLCSQESLQTAEDKEKFVCLIMDGTVNINCNDADRNTPLMILCERRTDESILQDVDTLLSRRKDVEIKAKNKNGQSSDDIVENRLDLTLEVKFKQGLL